LGVGGGGGGNTRENTEDSAGEGATLTKIHIWRGGGGGGTYIMMFQQNEANLEASWNPIKRGRNTYYYS